jgi:hypothetical protein
MKRVTKKRGNVNKRKEGVFKKGKIELKGTIQRNLGVAYKKNHNQ